MRGAVHAQDHAARAGGGHDEVVGGIQGAGWEPEACPDVEHGKDAPADVDHPFDRRRRARQRRDGDGADELAHVGGGEAVAPALDLENEDFEAGRQKPDFAPYFGKELTPQDLCRLRGAWQAKWGGA